MLSYAKACCELKGIEGVPNVIDEAGRVVVDGTLLNDLKLKGCSIPAECIDRTHHDIGQWLD
jgi:hypothetical protein